MTTREAAMIPMSISIIPAVVLGGEATKILSDNEVFRGL